MSDGINREIERNRTCLENYYLRRDDLIVNEDDALIRQCSDLYDVLLIDHDPAVQSTNIRRLLETGHTLDCTTSSGDNALLLAANNDRTDVLIELIRSQGNARYVLRPNLTGVNCLGSYLRNTTQLESLQALLRTLIECATVSNTVLVVVTLHQWLIVSTSDQEHNCRSLNQVIDQLDRFNLFVKLTSNAHTDDFTFGRQVCLRYRQMEVISHLLHQLIQPKRSPQTEKYVARLKQCLVERLNMPDDQLLAHLLATNQMTKKVLLPEPLSRKLVARSSHHLQVMRPVREHENIKPTAHMFIVGGFVQAENATTSEIIRVDIDYLEAIHRTDWFDDDLLEYCRYFKVGEEDAQISRLNNCRQIIQVYRANDSISFERQKSEKSTTTRGRELRGLTSHAMTRYGHNMVIHGGAGNDTLDSGAQLAAFDITNRRWTPIEQRQRQSKMYGHSAEVWRDRFYTFFGVYEAPGGENSYSSSVKYIDLNRPCDGWHEVINDQGDTNRAIGTPKARYRQRTFLYKDYVAVFGGGHHRAEPERLTNVFFFDLRLADKLMKSGKPIKNVWTERDIQFDADDPTNDDLAFGRIHFSISAEINGPRVYVAGGLTVSNGQEKLLDSIYEFNIHANNGQAYRDSFNRLVPMKQVRTFNPRKDAIVMTVRRIGTLQSPINYHASALCDENAVLYIYGGTQLKERLGPTSESNKERVSHFQTLRVNPSRLATLCRRELLRRRTRRHYRHACLLTGRLSQERSRLRNLNRRNVGPDLLAKEAKRSKLEVYNKPNNLNVMVRTYMSRLDADNFISWVEGNTFEKLELYQTMRSWYQPQNSWDSFKKRLVELRQRHVGLGMLMNGNVYEAEQLKLFEQYDRGDQDVTQFSNQNGKALLALVKRLQHEPPAGLIDEVDRLFDLKDRFLLCTDDTLNGFSSLHYICLFGSIAYLDMLNEALESPLHRHEILRQTRNGYVLLTLAFARLENARDFVHLIFDHTQTDEEIGERYFKHQFNLNAWLKSFEVVFEYWKRENWPRREDEDNYNAFIKQKASQLAIIRIYGNKDSVIVIENEFALHYLSKPSLFDEEKLYKWYLIHDSFVTFLFAGYKRRHEKERPKSDERRMNCGIESEWPQYKLNIGTFGVTSLYDTGGGGDRVEMIDRTDFLSDNQQNITFGDGRLMLTTLDKKYGPNNDRILKIIKSPQFTNLMNWRFADVDRRNPRTKWRHFVNYYFPEMSNALFVYANGEYLLKTREFTLSTEDLYANKFVESMGASYYASNIEASFVHSYERLEMNLQTYVSYFDGERRGETIGKFAELNKRLRWLFKLCEALEFMHERRLQHLDIKPQNIMLQSFMPEQFTNDKGFLDLYLNYPQVVKLADLGACKNALNSSTASNLRRASPMYASPEQISWMGTVSAASDIYSLGHVMAVLLLNQDQYRDYALKAALGNTVTLVERNRRLDNFPFTVTHRMKMANPEERLPLKLVKRELKRQIRISRIRRIQNGNSDVYIKAAELSGEPLYSHDTDHPTVEFMRLKNVRELLERHPDAAFPVSANTISFDWLHATLKTSLTTSNCTIFDSDVANITAPVNETLKSNLDVLFASVSNLRSALIRLFLRFHIDLVQLFEQDAEFSFMRMAMVACFCLAPRAIDGLDRFEQMNAETKRRIASQTSYVANTIYKIGHGTFATGEGWRLFPSVRRLFARFGIDMDDINVSVIQSRHPDWEKDDMRSFDDLIKTGTPVVVSCYEDFSNFPGSAPGRMTAGNIINVETTDYIIKTPQKDTRLMVNTDNPSAYRMFQHRRKPSALRDGVTKVNDRAWFVDSLGYSIDLRVNEGMSSKYLLKIENIKTPDIMFARQLLNQVTAVFYRRQRNLKQILLGQLQAFLLEHHRDVNCGGKFELGHSDADIEQLSTLFELDEDACTITQLVTSFRKSVLGYLEDQYLQDPGNQLSDAVLFDHNGLYGKDLNRHFDFGFLLEFEECVDFRDETDQSNERQSVFNVALIAKHGEAFNDMNMHLVQLDGSQVKLAGRVIPAKLVDPVQKYFTKHQRNIQSFQSKLYQQVNSRLYSGYFIISTLTIVLQITSFRYGEQNRI